MPRPDSACALRSPSHALIGALLLKEMFDLTDAETVWHVGFDLGWHVALDMEPEEAHVRQKTGKVRASFDGEGCEACPHRDTCPAKPLHDGRRVLRTTVHAIVLARRTTVHAAAPAKRRRYERTKEFKKRYAMRSGIEATNSELKRAHGLGRLRVRGGLRVRLAA